jgi:hypothetical protein
MKFAPNERRIVKTNRLKNAIRVRIFPCCCKLVPIICRDQAEVVALSFSNEILSVIGFICIEKTAYR